MTTDPIVRCHDCLGKAPQSEMLLMGADAEGNVFVLRAKRACVRCAAKYHPILAARMVADGIVAPEPDLDAAS